MVTLSSGEWLTLLGQLLLSGTVLGLNYMLVATGFWLIYATTRTFHLAHAVTYAVAGYAIVIVCNLAGLPLWLGIPAALVAATLFIFLIEVVVYRPLRERGASVLGIFLASLGIAIAGPNLIQILFGPEVFRIPSVPNMTLTLGTLTITALHLTMGFVSLILVILVNMLLARSRIGHAISAVRSNPALAMSVGISRNRVFMTVFAMGGALIGVTGGFATLDSAASATMGLQPVLYGLIGIFLGGTASIRGAALGGFLLGFLLVFSGLLLSPDFGIILVFALLVIVLIFRPEGLLSGGFVAAGEDARR